MSHIYDKSSEIDDMVDILGEKESLLTGELHAIKQMASSIKLLNVSSL